MANKSQTVNEPRAYAPVRAERALADYSTVLVVIILLIFFGATSQKFLLPENLINITKQMAVVGVLAIGMTMVILIGGIDLSVGSVVLLSAGITTKLLEAGTMTAAPAMALGLLAGMGVGLLNGLLIEIGGISPVIATLGTLIGIRGLAQIAIDNTWVSVTDPAFDTIILGKIPLSANIAIPYLTIIMLMLYLIAAVVLRQTRVGRYLYAIGGNPIASRLSGLPVTRTKILVCILCGLFAGIGGMLLAAYVGQVGPSHGAGLEFNAIAAVVLGGTRLGGGSGRVEKTLFGTLIYTMVLNYLTLARVDAIWQTTVTGGLVLLAVLLDRAIRRRQGV